MLKKIFRSILYFLGFLVIFIIGYLGTEYVFAKWTVNKDSPIKKDILIYVQSNGVHTDIFLPVKTEIIDWSTIFPYKNNKSQSTDYKFVGIGWGDKGFYLDTPEWKDLKASTAFEAATGLGESALHVTYLKNVSEDELTKPIWISFEQYNAIIKTIKNTIEWKNNEVIYISTDAQYGLTDAFYEAEGSYSIFHTCNTWTNNVLKNANLKASKWLAFDKGILYQNSK